MSDKTQYLTEHGWQEVPARVGTCWRYSFGGKDFYFELEAAYLLETEGDGIIAYATNQNLADQFKSEDIQRLHEAERLHIEAGGKPHGEYPNY